MFGARFEASSSVMGKENRAINDTRLNLSSLIFGRLIYANDVSVVVVVVVRAKLRSIPEISNRLISIDYLRSTRPLKIPLRLQKRVGGIRAVIFAAQFEKRTKMEYEVYNLTTTGK